MRPEPGQVLHFSEDPTITRFVPHVARTAQQPEPYVWAVSWDQAPDYWFPRQCPRAMAWRAPWSTEEDVRTILGPSGTTDATAASNSARTQRVHAVEYGWLEPIRTTQLYAYRFAEEDFTPFGDPKSPHAMVCDHEVAPLGPPERVGNLLTLHHEAGIELRVLPNLWPFWDAVVTSTLDFSGIRLRNAIPRGNPQTRSHISPRTGAHINAHVSPRMNPA